MIPLFTRPIDSLEPADLETLLTQAYPEGEQVEYKGALPNKKGGEDPWYSGSDQIEEYARNQLLEEIVAFANAQGGHLLLGVEESSSKPPVAGALRPLPRCAELAEKIRLQARDCIEPQLPAIHIRGLVTGPGGEGVVVVRVPRSMAAPHRLAQTLHCYYRRSDRSEKMTMREIKELTLSRDRESEWTAAHFERRSALFAKAGQTIPVTHDGRWIAGVRVTCIPTGTPLRMGRLVANPSFEPPFGYAETKLDIYRDAQLDLPISRDELGKRPVLRGLRYDSVANSGRVILEILEDGIVDQWVFHLLPDETGMMSSAAILGPAASALITTDYVRRFAGRPEAEYGVELELKSFPRVRYRIGRDRTSSLIDSPVELAASLVLPRLSLGTQSELPTLISILHRDLWNSAGVEPAWALDVKIPPRFLR